MKRTLVYAAMTKGEAQRSIRPFLQSLHTWLKNSDIADKLTTPKRQLKLPARRTGLPGKE